jgi:hypothetical protein
VSDGQAAIKNAWECALSGLGVIETPLLEELGDLSRGLL